MQKMAISPCYDYSDHYVTVNGSNMHYIELGAGDPILFVHGMPTWSYVWRNILPVLSADARAIAVDLIGMGKSDKPAIEYTLADHIAYFDGFVKTLNLRNVTLVMHGWGSVIGCDYARRHADNVAGLVFYEAHLRPDTTWEMLSLPMQHLASLLHSPDVSYRAIVEQNYLVRKLLPGSLIRRLSQDELGHYEAPFSTPESRKPLWQFIRELPLGDATAPVLSRIQEYSDWLQTTAIPKLLLYAIPGFMTTMQTVAWALDSLPNLTVEELDDALHLAQEAYPELFGGLVREWYNNCVARA